MKKILVLLVMFAILLLTLAPSVTAGDPGTHRPLQTVAAMVPIVTIAPTPVCLAICPD